MSHNTKLQKIRFCWCFGAPQPKVNRISRRNKLIDGQTILGRIINGQTILLEEQLYRFSEP